MSRPSSVLIVVIVVLVSVPVWLAANTLGAPGGPLAASAERLATFTTIFLGIFIEAVPFLLLGTLASGLVEVYVSHDHLSRLIPRNALGGALAGSLMGLAFPVCECGVVPLVRRLFRKGLPAPVGVAFLLAAPVLNPVVIASTAAAFGFGRVLVLRLGLTLFVAVAAGLVFAAQTRPERLLRPAAWAPMAGASQALPAAGRTAKPGWRAGLRRVATITADEFFEMGRYLVIGALLAAGLQTLVPQTALLALGQGPVLSVLTLAALAVVLSICSTVDAFVALSFAGTFTTGSILTFLVFGPMIDVKSTLMYLGLFRRRTVVYLVLLTLMLTIVPAVYINLNTAW